MKLIVGLGNPGSRYAATRHNIGFRIVECFAARHGIALAEERFGGRFGRGPGPESHASRLDVAVLEPLTFMNLAGDSVAAALESLPVDDLAADLLVVLDDVDLPFGRLRLRPAGGAGGHRGLAHLIECLGSSDFPRLRFGVGRPPELLDTADYVLQPFDPDEEARVGARVAAAAEALDAALVLGIGAAMNRFNRDAAPEDEKPLQ